VKLEFASATTEGRRASNEDACCARPAIGLFAVADGMGGYEGGEVASRIAIETLVEFWSRVASGADVHLPQDPDLSRPPAENVAAAAIRLADARIKAQRNGRFAQMGSTVAMIRAHDGHLVFGHVGDSRIYRLRDAALARLTRDHSLYEDLAASGAEVPPRDAFPHAHVITRALGIEKNDTLPELRSDRIAVGDTFLLCTDGLTDVLSDDQIRDHLGAVDLGKACEGLVSSAFAGGSRDNITVVVVRRVA
jgi:serine/threonine protein phosphatase PrpC